MYMHIYIYRQREYVHLKYMYTVAVSHKSGEISHKSPSAAV